MPSREKLTKNQQVVYDALSRARTPLSAYEILDTTIVRKKGLRAPLTIYCALDKLRKIGLMHRIESLNSFVVCCSEPHEEPVAFAICTDCHAVTEMRLIGCDEHISASACETGFEVETLRVELLGRCSSCSNDTA